jgi:ABC-type branched-subunit amino acid transport system ATPase component
MELARALAGQPRILLLDETLAGLGHTEAEEMIGIIRRLAQDGITIVIIEHTMQAMVRLVDRFVVLDHGAVLVEGSPESVTRDPRVIEAYLGKKWTAYAKVRRLSAGYSDLPVISDVSITVKEGQFVSIVGPNGAGKTTLFKTISGILTPKSGSMQFESVDLSAVPAARRPHLGIAHVPEGRQVFPSLTVMENLEMGAFTEAGSAQLEAEPGAHPDLAAGAGGSPHSARRDAVGRRAADGGGGAPASPRRPSF